MKSQAHPYGVFFCELLWILSFLAPNLDQTGVALFTTNNHFFLLLIKRHQRLVVVEHHPAQHGFESRFLEKFIVDFLLGVVGEMDGLWWPCGASSLLRPFR